jgi:two-component system phosphate regulon sensor histidine kinase PhoR
MTDARPEAVRREGVSLSLMVAASGIAVLVLLWALGWLRTAPALVASMTVAAVGVLAYARRRPSAVRSLDQSGSGAVQGEARALPFALILERLADPVLLAAGGERTDLNARRFLFANAAARALLRIQRPEGPLSTAIRAPEVLAAVDEALFDRVTGHALYQAGGVQDRVWRVRVEPLDVEGETRLALISLRDETEFRRSERTRADFWPMPATNCARRSPP